MGRVLPVIATLADDARLGTEAPIANEFNPIDMAQCAFAGVTREIRTVAWATRWVGQM